MKRISLYLIALVLVACNKSDTPVPLGLPTDPPQYGAAFASVPESNDAAIYQVNIRTFSPAGNLAGVTARLDQIKDLGVNVLYLMPVYPVGVLKGFNSPYAVKDYKAVNTEFGTIEDLRTLVETAHSKGLAVIMDWVANHTAWDNAWIANKTWYIRNAQGVIQSPPGYDDVAQLDFSNRDMRAAMLEALRYWIFTANIDGYRFDFADNDPFDFWKPAITSLNSISNHKLLMLAEGSRNDHFNAGFQMKYGFSFYATIKDVFGKGNSATTLNALNTTEYANAKEQSQVVRYITNHDVNSSDGTALDLFDGKKGSMAAFVVAAYMKGVPMIYNGQEVGTPFRLSFPFTGAKIDWSLNPDVTAEYKKVLEVRNASNAIRRGQLFGFSSDDVCAFTKEIDNEKVLVLINLRNKMVDYTLPTSLANTTWNDAMSTGTKALTTSVTLEPYAYLILKK